MTDDLNGLPLTVSVPATEWAYIKRRVRYLEAVMLQVLRDRARVREWFCAAELAALRLPGLPRSKAGVTRLATAHDWRRRIVTGRGGERYEYHVASLPPRAFDALVELIVDALPTRDQAPAPALPQAAPQTPRPAAEDDPAPAWLLPLMRLVKGGASGTLADICKALPEVLPAGVAQPTPEEVAEALRRLGFAV